MATEFHYRLVNTGPVALKRAQRAFWSTCWTLLVEPGRYFRPESFLGLAGAVNSIVGCLNSTRCQLRAVFNFHILATSPLGCRRFRTRWILDCRGDIRVRGQVLYVCHVCTMTKSAGFSPR